MNVQFVCQAIVNVAVAYLMLRDSRSLRSVR